MYISLNILLKIYITILICYLNLIKLEILKNAKKAYTLKASNSTITYKFEALIELKKISQFHKKKQKFFGHKMDIFIRFK